MTLHHRFRTCMITADVDEASLVRQVERALAFGVDFVQLRRKQHPAREIEDLAKRLTSLSPGLRRKSW